MPYGYSNGNSVDTTLSLLGSQPLGSGADAPFLHRRILSWTHTFNREEDNRANSFVGVLGIAVPVAEFYLPSLLTWRTSSWSRKGVSTT